MTCKLATKRPFQMPTDLRSNNRKQATGDLTSSQTPAIYTSHGCRKVSTGINPNNEILDASPGVTSDPGGPLPAGQFGCYATLSSSILY